jgi:hypothetical protein
MPRGSGPLATFVQLPTVPFRLHARHAPPQALLQQTPSAQKLLPHSFADEHVAPSGFKPHELMTPFMPQMFGVMHSALVLHEVKHLPTLQ